MRLAFAAAVAASPRWATSGPSGYLRIHSGRDGVLLGIVTLPLWLVPPLWPAIPVAILGWVNQKVLRYDALSEHASAEEMRALFAANRGALFGLGVVLAILAYVPPLGFLAPVLSSLAFVHFLLGDLEKRRGAPIEGEARVIT